MTTDKQLFDLVLGAIVHHRRKAKKWTQLDLAKRLKVSQSTVTRIEAGVMAVSASTMGDIARAFRSTTKDVYDFLCLVNVMVKLVRRAANAAARDVFEKNIDVSGLVHFVVAARLR